MDLLATVPLVGDPKRLLLEMAKEHHLPELLRLLVSRLTDSPRVAMARVWLVRSGDICESCPMKNECPNREQCLHLVASAGRSTADAGVEWTRLDGAFRRFPLGVRKVGRIWASGEAIEAPDLSTGAPDWVAKPDWLRAEGISGFGGQPLVHRGETLGVLAVLDRKSVV